MALIRCAECKARMSDKASACPKCGAPLEVSEKKQKARISNGCGCLIICLVVGVIFAAAASTNKSNALGSTAPRQPSPPENPAKAWYSGGTLHSAKMSEWSRASYPNRLATSADFVAKILETEGIAIPSVDQLKPLAQNLETAITTAHVEGVTDNEKVSTLAAACWLLIKHER